MSGVLALSFTLLLPVVAAGQLGPQTVVRRFCEADAMAQRVTIQGWSRIAPLVEWPLEPAWDRVHVITSYTVGWPEATDNDMLAVEVRYAVTADINALAVKQVSRVDAVRFRVRAEGTSWRIAGPPPPPYIFEQQVDPEAMRLSLERGGMNFTANSVFVWRMMQTAGWPVDYVPTADLLKGQSYRAAEKAKPGDLVVYLNDETPYHVGFLEGSNTVVSATLNGGILRTRRDAFAGESRTLRLVRPAATPKPASPSLSGPAPGSGKD
jgi:hypothetical protein